METKEYPTLIKVDAWNYGFMCPCGAPVKTDQAWYHKETNQQMHYPCWKEKGGSDGN